MGKLNQPGKAIKFSNVSVVRLKRGGKKFEIASYPNKVIDWRKGLEKELDSVVQILKVFSNCSKGDVAADEDLKTQFNTTNHIEIIKEILEKGDLQIGEKERMQQSELLFKDVCNLISSMTVDPTTNRPYTSTMIEKALLNLHFNPNPNKKPKQLCLEAIKLLQKDSKLPIERTRLKVKIFCRSSVGKAINDQLNSIVTESTLECKDDNYQMICTVEPDKFKVLSDLVSKASGGDGFVELIAN